MEYLKITLDDVLVTSVDVSGAQGAEVMVNYSFQAAKVKWWYRRRTTREAKRRRRRTSAGTSRQNKTL